MHETVIIYLHDITLSSVSWTVSRENGDIPDDVQIGSLGELSSICNGRKVALVIPGNLLTYASVQLPATDRERMMRALPYAMEDRIIDEVDNLHFAINSWKDNQVNLSAISRQQMDFLIERMNNHGISADYIFPDIFMLPYKKAHWTVLVTSKYTLVRTGKYSGFTADNYNSQQILSLNLAQSATLPASITVIYRDEPEELDLQKLISDYPSVSFSSEKYNDDFVKIFSENFSENLPFTLLQGKYSKHEQLANIWRSWRPVAVLLVVFIILYITSLSINVVQLNKRIATVDKQINTLFRKTLPDTKKVINPRAQLQQRIAELTRDSDNVEYSFLSLLGKSANVLSNNKNLKLNSMAYKENELDIELVINDFQNLDSIKSKIEAQGVQTEILSATADGTSVLGRIRISGNK